MSPMKPSSSNLRRSKARAPRRASSVPENKEPSSSTTSGTALKRQRTSTARVSEAKRSKTEDQENIDPVILQSENRQDVEVKNDQDVADLQEEANLSGDGALLMNNVAALFSNHSTPTVKAKIHRISDAQRAIFKVAIKRNEFPEKSVTCLFREDLIEENNTIKLIGKHECFICRGFYDDAKSKNIRCQGHTGSRDCVIKMHAKCAPNYSPGGLNIPYAALIECQNKVLCPLHSCSACDRENFKQRAYEGTIIQCMKCLRGFHKQCLPVGSVKKTIEVQDREGSVERLEMIVCPNHIEEKIDIEKHLEICAKCSKETGDLQHCRLCLQSYHVEDRIVKKLNGGTVPERVCDDCCSETTIRNGSLVIFYDGNEFVLAKTANSDTLELGYTNLHLSDGTSTQVHISHIAPVKPAYLSKIHQDEQNRWKNELKNIDKLPDFPQTCKEVVIKLKANRIKSVKLPIDQRLTEKLGSMKDCETYDSYNCDCPSTCKPINGCRNQNISGKQVNPNMKIHYYPGKGFGVRALANMMPGDFLGEYVGEPITDEEMKKRKKFKEEVRDEQAPHYFMEVGSGVHIDAARMGNITRFFNHSCDPNADSHKRHVVVNRRVEARLVIVARKEIKAEDEITIDYQWPASFMKCRCGEKNCKSKKE